MINPHGMDPQTVLRFVKSVGAWPGGHGDRLRAGRRRGDGLGPLEQVEDAVERAVASSLETIAELRAERRRRAGG